MSIKGTWSIGYVYYQQNTANNASMTITSESPLAGTCTIEGTTMNIAAGAVVSVFNGQWVWFTCTEPGGDQYFFVGCIEPSNLTITGGTIIPQGPTMSKKRNRKDDKDDTDGDSDTDDVGTDPGDLGGWVATHQ